MTRPTILLADDHTIVLEGLAGLLRTEFSLVGAVPDGDRLLAEAQRLRPDVIVTDMTMPGLSGIDPNQPFDARVRDLLLAALYSAPSTLSLIPFQDAIGTRERINVPGTVNDTNWRYRIPRTVDDLLADDADTDRLRRLATDGGRLETPR